MTLDTTTHKKNTGSSLISHNVMVNGHRTSVRLEKEMWLALKDVAKRESCTLHDVVSEIASHKRPQTSLTAAIRVFMLAYFQAAATEDGHFKAGHGMGPHVAIEDLNRHANTPYYGIRQFKGR
jgi:predicted DNA-binding ribbon-helix-helix protein